MTSCNKNTTNQEIQITNDLSYNHDLDNNDNFSPDDQWLVYDTRTEKGGIGGCATIEKINIKTGEVRQVFHIEHNQDYGPGVGAVSYSPRENRVVFIHGLNTITEENPYQQWRRTGVIVNDNQPNVPIYMDSRDVIFPFTPGALRGGTHRHEWSGDGHWIGFTYNDAIMKALEDSTGEKRNLRTIGVSSDFRSVQVDDDPNGENVSGTWYSVLVVRVVPNPTRGSDEISYAAEDSWVGTNGYLKKDGTRQMARAFIGTTVNRSGQPVNEVYIVDIPQRIDVPGDFGPLEGTKTSFPMPPKGTVQRRLTHTADSPYPGCSGVTRSSANGSMIAFVARDKNGVKQIFLISPLGGEPRQLTVHETDVQSCVRWNPNGKQVCYIWDKSLIICDVSDAPFESRYRRLTSKSEQPPVNMVWSHDGAMIAYNKMASDEKHPEPTQQVFVIKL